jgi:DNA-binding NarL/FixJ family response regulator
MDRIVTAVWSPDPLIGEGIASMLRPASDVEVVSAENVANARIAMLANPSMDVDITRKLATVHAVSSARIIVVVDEITDSVLNSMSNRRVAAVVAHSSATSAGLVRTVRDVCHGRTLPSLREQAGQVRSGLAGPGFGRAPELGLREREVLKLLVEGYDTTAIARRMAYSERTVKNIVRSTLTQLSARNRAHAVAVATRSGLI